MSKRKWTSCSEEEIVGLLLRAMWSSRGGLEGFEEKWG